MIDFRDDIPSGRTGRYPLDPAAVIGIAIHHCVGHVDPAWAQAAEEQHLYVIDAQHIGQGFGGFGYHLAAFPSGRVYYCGDLGFARAHVASRNFELIGVALMGAFTAVPPPDAQLRAAAEAVAFVRQAYPGVLVAGHRQWALPQFPTACPGDTFADWVPGLSSVPVAANPGLDELVTFFGQVVQVGVLVDDGHGGLKTEPRPVTYREFVQLHAAGLVAH